MILQLIRHVPSVFLFISSPKFDSDLLILITSDYICGNFTFETLNLHARESTLVKIVPQGLIRNTEVIVKIYYFTYMSLPMLFAVVRASQWPTGQS